MSKKPTGGVAAGRVVSDLPDDLLFLIFWFSRPLLHSDSDEEDEALSPKCRSRWPYASGTSINFSRVCRRWRRVALACPLLWTSVDLWHTAFSMEILRRAGNAPLHVCWSEEAFYKPDAPMPLNASLNMVMTRLSQIRTLDLSFRRGSELRRLVEWHNQPAPFLESLRIMVDPESSANDFPYNNFPDEAADFVPGADFLHGQAPRLQKLVLQGLFIDESWPPFTQLRALHLEYSYYTIGPVITLDDFLLLLARMPLLEKLLTANALIRSEESYTHLDTAVTLHRLRELNLNEDGDESLALLRNLFFPPLESLHITIRPTREPHTFFETASLFGPLLRPHIEAVATRLACSYVGLLAMLPSFVAQDQPGMERHRAWLHISFDDRPSTDGYIAMLATLPLCVPMDSIVHLEVPNSAIYCDTSQLSTAQWAVLIPQLPSLQTLSVRSKSGCTLVEALSGPHSRDLCPALHTLILAAVPLRSRVDGAQSLLEALPGLITARQELERPLAVLGLHDVHPLAIEALRAALGTQLDTVRFESVPAVDGSSELVEPWPACEYETDFKLVIGGGSA